MFRENNGNQRDWLGVEPGTLAEFCKYCGLFVFSATFAGERFRCTCFALPLGISRRTMPAAVPLPCWVATIAVILGFIADSFSLSARREVGGGKLNSMLAGAAAFEAGCLHLLALTDGWLPGRDCKCSRSDFQ